MHVPVGVHSKQPTIPQGRHTPALILYPTLQYMQRVAERQLRQFPGQETQDPRLLE